MSLTMIRLLFVIAGLYDFLIGLAFLFFGRQLFVATGVPQPSHWGYIQFGSLMLAIFGAMFFSIAYDPLANRKLIPYGMLLKLSYTGLICYYWVTTDCPLLFKPFAIIDGPGRRRWIPLRRATLEGFGTQPIFRRSIFAIFPSRATTCWQTVPIPGSRCRRPAAAPGVAISAPPT
jgi:hypothetical protein